MTNNLLFQFPIDNLATAIVEQLKPLLTNSSTSVNIEEKFYTRLEAAKKLNVSLPTLSKYTKQKIILSFRFGKRILFKHSDIEKALIQINYKNPSYHQK